MNKHSVLLLPLKKSLLLLLKFVTFLDKRPYGVNIFNYLLYDPLTSK